MPRDKIIRAGIRLFELSTEKVYKKPIRVKCSYTVLPNKSWKLYLRSYTGQHADQMKAADKLHPRGV